MLSLQRIWKFGNSDCWYRMLTFIGIDAKSAITAMRTKLNNHKLL